MKLYYNNKEILCEVISEVSTDDGWELEIRPFSDELFRLHITPMSEHPFITLNQSKQKYYIIGLVNDCELMIIELRLMRWNKR